MDVGPVGHGGFCVARHRGRVVFVRHALPGERVLAVVTEDRGGSYCRADAVQVLRPSPDRVPARCPVAGPGGCGGCDWQHASVTAQLRGKADVVREQFRRIAGVDLDRGFAVEPLPGGPLGWRSRVRLAVGQDGRAGLRRHRSDQVVPLDGCPLAVPDALTEVLAGSWAPGTEIEVTVGDDGVVHVAELPAGDRPAAHDHSAVGDRPVVRRAAGRSWHLSPDTFWQVHPAAAGALAGVVGSFAGAAPGGLVWDLYGGAGLFAAVLAGQVGPDGTVLVVESSRGAVADGVANLADLPQVRFRTGRVERVLGRLPGRPDVVVLDPPRRGAGRAVALAVAERRPAQVVHIACDPAALARDVAAFADRGYRLAGLRAFDAFPMTHHVECVALLTHPTHPGERR